MSELYVCHNLSNIKATRRLSLHPWNMRGNIKRIWILISLYHRIYRTFMKPNLYWCGILGHNFHNKRGVKRNIDWGSFNLPIMAFHHCFYSLKSCLIDDYSFYFVCDERRLNYQVARLALFISKSQPGLFNINSVLTVRLLMVPRIRLIVPRFQKSPFLLFCLISLGKILICPCLDM